MLLLAACPCLFAGACAEPPPAAAPALPAPSSSAAPVSEAPTLEPHLKQLEQLTFGGENAEAYWSFDGQQLIIQAHKGEGCDQIYRMRPGSEPVRVSTGHGSTTCSYFLPGDQEIIYASTHLGGEACPPKPDHSQGYVWALYDSYDIFRANADGSNLRQLTNSPGYDAEATVCKKDGSIVFTSVRDGDIELYRMNADGSNVKRLTHTPGYDGGAFFNDDCTKLVWRASRPKGPALGEFRALLAKHLVRPTQLELYVGDADGSNATQVTYLNAASFAPFFYPGSQRIIFSSNHGDARGREFDLWAINSNGTGLERITRAPGFDGFPIFSPDGKTLAFSSNRATAPGQHDTNVFLAQFDFDAKGAIEESGADRIQKDIAWLADPAREGRGLGTKGLTASGEYIERRFKELGLAPAGDSGTYRDDFEVAKHVLVGKESAVKLGAQALEAAAFQPLAFSATGQVAGELVLAGYGVSAKELKVDDYKGLNVKGKVVVVRRFVAETPAFAQPANQRRYGDLWYKAVTARMAGAAGVIVVDAPVAPPNDKKWKAPDEAKFPELTRENYGDAGIPVVIVKRDVFAATLKGLEQRKKVQASLNVALSYEKQAAFNVIAKIVANAPAAERLPGAIAIGAHYDHLGYGGVHSLAPDSSAPHVGADDNASGVAGVLEIARALKAAPKLKQDVYVMAFSAEESGVLGSSHLVHEPPAGLEPKKLRAMLNLDMVGRLRDNQLTVLGSKTAKEWESIVGAACEREHIECAQSSDGYGPSDQTSFYAAGVPVLHFFSGSHTDYHKPTDTADRINAGGAAQIAKLVTDVAQVVTDLPAPLTFQAVAPETPKGDVRSFNASLGTIPDYAGPTDGGGVLLAGVRPGSAAEKAGLRRGDTLVALGKTELKSLHDFMFVLNGSKPGQTVTARVKRDGKVVDLQVTFEEKPPRKE
ncbi:MAG TPA: M20/M25/M40 family metallo-hydrolase [Polyangiaceae bacterium]|nr:M20/M25/M40 family metallo-hydrolase [Polyangiaceae bacterium]